MKLTNPIYYSAMWNKVKERLPKNNKDVIVWNTKSKSFREDYYSRSAGIDGDGWWYSNQDEISHWMPIALFNKMILKTIPK